MRSLIDIGQKIILLSMVFVACLLFRTNALAQDVAFDHPVQCGALQCYPSTTMNNEFFYLSSNPHVSFNKQGKPEASFLRFHVEKSPASSGNTTGQSETGGGAIVHILVDFTVSKKELRDAKEDLHEIFPEAVLRDPISFKSGNYALIATGSAKADRSNKLTRRVLGVGHTRGSLNPAIAMRLSKQDASILWSSFHMDTPDVFLIFEMPFSGFVDTAEATAVADLTMLKKHAKGVLGEQGSDVKLGTGFDFENFWKGAMRNSAISINYRGNYTGAQLQSIINVTYTRIHDMMFEAIPVKLNNADLDKESLQRMKYAIAVVNWNALVGQNYHFPWEAKINGEFRLRNNEQSGKLSLDFRKGVRSTRVAVMKMDLGLLYKSFGENTEVFRTIGS